MTRIVVARPVGRFRASRLMAALAFLASTVFASPALAQAPDASSAQAAGAVADDPVGTSKEAGQTSEPAPVSPPASEADGTSGTTAAAAQDPDDDMVLNPAQPDFTLVNLPTTLRLAKGKLAFRVTHRFNRPLGQGDFGDLVEDFFGFDGGSLIGLELRVGVWRGLQAGIYRTSNKTIEFFSQYSTMRQSESRPIGIDAWVSIEGTNNFKDSYSPALGAIISRTIGEHAAIYAMPIWINNTDPLPSELSDDNDTFLLGFGGRVRVMPTVYVVGEFAPRVAGHDPGDHLISFAIEKRVGGHAFQINFSNSVGSTMAQVARSFANNDDWFIGFNISRKFY